MKCSFCGKELEQGAEFCPECGMILSLGDVDTDNNEIENTEVPEFTPNVFRGMEFEEEPQIPAMELEVEENEEIAPVVEAIPEFSAAEEPQQEAVEETVEDGFAVPEYDPTAEVSSDFSQEAVADTLAMAVREAQEADVAETGFAPPEYDNTPINIEPQPVSVEQKTVMIDPEQAKRSIEQAEEKANTEAIAEPVVAENEVKEQAYPSYRDETAENVKKAIDDDSLIEALFDSVTVDEDDDYEDITETYNEPKKKNKSSNTGYAMVFLLVAVLVGIIFATGHIVDNVLPSIRDKQSTSEAEEVDATADEDESEGFISTSGSSTTDDGTKVSSLPGLMTTTSNPSSTSTTDGTSTGVTSSTSTASTSATTTTTRPTTTTTTRPTTTTTRPTTTEPTTQYTTEPTTAYTTTASDGDSYTFNADAYVQKPSSYNIYEKTVYPDYNAIALKNKPSSSGETLYTLSYGYPLTAYAEENGYYYVLSHRYGIYGWVSVSDVYEYDNSQTTTTQQTTTSSATTTTGSSSDTGYTEYSSAYKAVINSPDGLNFRTGPGTDYSVSLVVPAGFYVTVYGYSSYDSDWVYVTVTDSNYPYGSPSGWVHSDYLS